MNRNISSRKATLKRRHPWSAKWTELDRARRRRDVIGLAASKSCSHCGRDGHNRRTCPLRVGITP